MRAWAAGRHSNPVLTRPRIDAVELRLLFVVQRVLLIGFRLERTLDPKDRQAALRAVLPLAEAVEAGGPGLRLVALVQRIEPLALLVVQRAIEFVECRADDLHRLQHRIDAGP